LGGTFDPVHLGHLILAEESRLALSLNRVVFIPAGTPWRKADREITPAADRVAMVSLAILDNPAFELSPIEVERGGATYTADTLESLASTYGEEVDLWFILGSDALFDLPHWRDPQRIIALTRLAVAARAAGRDEAGVQELEARVPGIREKTDVIPMPRVQISSSQLRSRLHAGLSCRYWLPAVVEDYAIERRLYRRVVGQCQ
jgi:nicotinate-nucleotide adenylyltransferase